MAAHGTTAPAASDDKIVDVQVPKETKKRIPAATSKERKKDLPHYMQPKDAAIDSKVATKEAPKRPAPKTTTSPAA